MKVTKEITFDSAHMLSNYSGKCRNLHGHTYKLQVTIEGEICKVGDSCGMVVDFNELKQYLDTVTSPLDHSIVFSDEEYRSSAEDALLKWAEQWEMNYVIIPGGKSTCESMAAYIKEKVEDLVLLWKVNVLVKLWETPTSYVEV